MLVNIIVKILRIWMVSIDIMNKIGEVVFWFRWDVMVKMFWD